MEKDIAVQKSERIQIYPSAETIRLVYNDVCIANSEHALVLLERGNEPVYYVPQSDIEMQFLHANNHHSHCPYKGEAIYWDIIIGGKSSTNIAWSYPQPLAKVSAIKDHIAFYCGANKVKLMKE